MYERSAERVPSRTDGTFGGLGAGNDTARRGSCASAQSGLQLTDRSSAERDWYAVERVHFLLETISDEKEREDQEDRVPSRDRVPGTESGSERDDRCTTDQTFGAAAGGATW
jgi:hypothetical protein